MKKLLLCSVLGLSACLPLDSKTLSPEPPLSVLPYTVTIGVPDGSGSGISVASRDNYTIILTCHHVIDSEDKILVRRPGAKSLQAKVIADDAKDDLALIRVEASFPVAPRYSGDLTQGEELLVSGSPLGHGPMLSNGFVGPIDRIDGTQASTAPTWPGGSGGGAWVMRDNTWVLVGTMETIAVLPIQTPVGKQLPYLQFVSSVSFFIPEPIIEKFLHKSGY